MGNPVYNKVVISVCLSVLLMSDNNSLTLLTKLPHILIKVLASVEPWECSQLCKQNANFSDLILFENLNYFFKIYLLIMTV